MITDSEIRTILEGKIENDYVDIKRGFSWKKKSRCTLEVIRDILGMANIQDGGKIIIGFDEKTKEFEGDEDDWFSSFEQTIVMNLVNKYSASAIRLQVIPKENFEWKQKKGDLVILDISEFDMDPIIAKDGHDSDGKSVFYAADIFTRTNAASTEKIKDVMTMHNLLRRAASNHLKQIQKENSSQELYDSEYQNDPKNFKNIRESYLDEITDFAHSFHNNKFFPSINDGVWQVRMMPVEKKSNLIALKDLRNIATSSQSRHRGWPFPIVSYDMTKTKNGYLQTFVPLEGSIQNNEAWRLYRNGLFCWTKSMFENRNKQYENTLSKVNAIWTITEMFLFASRLYNHILSEFQDVYIDLTLTGPNGRIYHDEMFTEYKNPIDTGGKCDSDFIKIERILSVADLQQKWKAETVNTIEELDTHFDVQRFDVDYTVNMMHKLLGMQLIPPKY